MEAATPSHLERVPVDAPNRHKIAELLAVTETAIEHLEKDKAQAELYRRICSVARLIALTECAPKSTRASSAAHAALRRAVDAARKFGERNNLKPGTVREVLQEARHVLDSFR